MDRHDLLEHIRRQILNVENKANSRKSHGVEKVANKARKFRVIYKKVPSAKNTFEENVLRKAQSIRTSVAFKQCCRRLNSYEDENVEVISKPYNSMPSLYTSKSVSRVEKNNCKKSMQCFRSKQFPAGTCGSGSWAHKSLLTSAEEPQIKKTVVDVDRFLRNSKMDSHLLQSTRSCTKNKVEGITKGKIVQPQIAAISQHMNLNISGCEHNSSCDEISVKIKQSFSTLNDLENDIDKAARFLQASFSNRLSISSLFECGKMNDESSFKQCIMRKHPYNDHHFPKQGVKSVTLGKTLGCRLKAHIAYGRNVAEMSQHLRDVRDAFSSQTLLHKHEVDDVRNSLSNKICFDGQSSFYATVQQRMNKALQHNSVSNNMYQSSQYPLKERNYCDPIDLSTSSFSKIDSIQDGDSDDAKDVVRSTESKITPQTVVQQEKSSDMKLINESPSTYSTLNDVNQNDVVSSSPTYLSQELLRREHYASSTVRALRQFYRDSMLYFVVLRKLYRQQKIEGLWKVENEEERIKAACLLLKQKYIDSVRSAMPTKNLVDYHLHETARIQLLNLDLQKRLILLRGNKKNSSFEKLRHGSEKVLLLTKNFEKNNLANELEKWERKLKTRSRFKIDGGLVADIDNTGSLFSNPVRIVRNTQEVKVQNPRSYNRKLQQLREELKWKRKEADFLKRTFNQRMMRSDQSEENSLRAQIDAHECYITETEKDIAQLIRLQNGNDDDNERLTVIPTEKCESYPASPKLTSMEITAKRAFSDGRFSEPDKSKTSIDADAHSTSKSCSLEWDPEKRSIEITQYSKLILEEKSGTDGVSEKYKIPHSSGKTRGTCYSVELPSSSTLTPSRLISAEQLTDSLKPNYVEENCSVSDETPLDNKLFCSQDVPTFPKDPAHLMIYSPGSSHSSELLYGETGSFKQDISKEALLMSVICQSDRSYSQAEEKDKSAVQTIDGRETAADQSNLSSTIVDEQFFTPLPSDIEDNEKSDNEVKEERIASRESSSSFHTTNSSPVPDEQISSKTAHRSLLTLSPKSRKFKLTVSPLSSSKSLTSSRYAASMPRDDSSRSSTDSPRTRKTESNHCISPLSASLLESLLEDSLTIMLRLNRSQVLEDETFVLHEGHKLTASSATLPADSSWQSDQSYDLNRIPVPEDLIPGLDLSGINSIEAETITEKNDFSSKLEEVSSLAEIRNDELVKSLEPMSSQFRYYLSDEKWTAEEIHSVSEQIWNLASLEHPLEILVSNDPSGIASQEVQMRQMIADRCCEIAKCCFKDVGNRRYMGLTNINCFRPRNLLHLRSILQKQFSKYYESNKLDNEKKRWKSLSRDHNSDIENIILEELYAEQDGWEDILENYENEIKAELVAELWHEQLDESLSSAINV
ncbi:unnamed protein product [Cercopithifilaria johnstoni]|uniref:DUF4378 domain-containing protein n=1 Tax=Cercopithifilaria johnstoni TaxID=2874296 RepID=A0A8J2M5W8_9BILA|nr:unnamed protein product [Cercopithifilaria johnstoni]